MQSVVVVYRVKRFVAAGPRQQICNPRRQLGVPVRFVRLAILPRLSDLQVEFSLTWNFPCYQIPRLTKDLSTALQQMLSKHSVLAYN